MQLKLVRGREPPKPSAALRPEPVSAAGRSHFPVCKQRSLRSRVAGSGNSQDSGI